MEGIDIEPLVIDVIGLRCPIPVQRTRKALRTLPPGGVIHLIGDDPESMHDIPALIERLGLTEVEVRTDPLSACAGAIGAALWGAYRHERLRDLKAA